MSQKPDWLVAHGKPWRRGPPRPIYDNPWISLTEYDAVAPTGADALYGVVGFKNFALAILPVHDDGTITLVGQNRLPCDDYSWEIPEGGGPLADDPLESAKRELLEETGLAAARWREILRMQLSNSVTDEQAFGYLATGLSQVHAEPQGDGTEDILRARVPFREALDAAIGGYMRDALTVAMLLRGYHMAREGALPRELSAAMLG
ncbi:MAG: NUDIX hydrolase [Phenylobacterium sp.]|uniref:NUDIX domain-containing protein n=1 Tax=Phenylobacterium sp. TaxID=1871053 RepID=UPI0027286F26|nr:NUDIX hydrolase [Phenylobacterium sp.]MDO8913665.1 NUDIX hydrolase [Phenylobacterium sp.]MDP3099035.1 NUDIX hydrolase [Phenylobacterium sp.]MDP3868296.1 NUDIX hydrolase [Phenylobacterium sp.]HQT52738.1 NUDIX hydrolase [Phenylobacterium sp.]